MSGRIKNKTKCRYISLNIILLFMAFSFLFIQGNNIEENSLWSISVVSGELSVKTGISFGTHMCLDVGSVFATEIKSGMLLTITPSEPLSTSILTEFNLWIDRLSNITFISIISYTLYNILHSPKESKTWAKNRWLIKTTITQNPGISLRALSRSTGLAIGSTQYWLRNLQENNEIDELSFGKSKHFFNSKQIFTLEEKLVYSLLQNKRIREIINELNNYPTNLTQTELCTRLGLNKSLLSYYVKILKKHNILDTELNGLSITSDVKQLFNRKN